MVRVGRAFAWALWVAGLLNLAFALVRTSEGPWAVTTILLSGLAFGLVGLLLCVRTDSLMGWLFLLAQGFAGLDLADLMNANFVVLLVAAILVLFPDGHLPSPRWRWSLWGLGIVGSVAVVGELRGGAGWGVYMAFLLVVVPVITASIIRIVADYARARGQTRQQLKWLAWVLILGSATLAVSAVPIPAISRFELHNLAGVVLFVGSPVAIGLAVVRYRLYEIDRIVSRTISYSVVVTLLSAVVAAVAAVVGTRFQDPLVVAATTLGVAASFNPLRIRVQKLVDRRFNRTRYDHERIAQGFAASLRDRVDPDQIVAGWTGVVLQTMGPRSMAVWTKLS